MELDEEQKQLLDDFIRENFNSTLSEVSGLFGRTCARQGQKIKKLKQALNYYSRGDNWNMIDNGRGYEMYYIDDSDHHFVMGRGWSGGKRAKEILDIIDNT